MRTYILCIYFLCVRFQLTVRNVLAYFSHSVIAPYHTDRTASLVYKMVKLGVWSALVAAAQVRAGLDKITKELNALLYQGRENTPSLRALSPSTVNQLQKYGCWCYAARATML